MFTEYINKIFSILIFLIYNIADDSHLNYECNDRVVTINLKPLVICLLLEIEYLTERLPVIQMHSIVTASINDWFNDFNFESSIKLHALCYNVDYKSWEPLIDLCSEDDTTCRPWELMIKVRISCHSLISYLKLI